MRTLPKMIAMALALGVVPACKKKDEAKDDEKAEAKADADEEAPGGDEGEPTLMVAEGQDAVDGPVPPETSMVFYVIEGALLPIGCFDKEQGKLLSGAPCLTMVSAGEEARLSSLDSAFNRPVGEPTEPHCMAGSGRKVALAVEGITEGANFKYAAWPPSALKIVHWVPEDTMDRRATRLGDDEIEKLRAAMGRHGGRGDEVVAHQVAEIDVDDDGKKDKVYSVHIPHPTLSEQYNWSGIFWAKNGDLDDLVLLEQSRTKRDVFEVKATLDLDGDGTNELWLRLVFAEGAGDRIVQMKGGKPSALGAWTCGV
jgi:hypothetical protein